MQKKKGKQEKCKVTTLMLNYNFIRRTAGCMMHKFFYKEEYGTQCAIEMKV